MDRLELREMTRINNCKNCGGYGYYKYFDGGGSPEWRKCKVCKAKPSKRLEAING